MVCDNCGLALKLASERACADAKVVCLVLVAWPPDLSQKLVVADEPAGRAGQDLEQCHSEGRLAEPAAMAEMPIWSRLSPSFNRSIRWARGTTACRGLGTENLVTSTQA